MMQTTLSRNPTTELPGGEEIEELGRAVIKSVIDRDGSTYTVDVPDSTGVTGLATGLRAWLLIFGAGVGTASATVSPTFLGETYPAMLALVRKMEESGADWKPNGHRTIRVGNASHVFVSRDRPVAGKTPAPSGMLEVVDAHRIDKKWFAERVVPRCSRPGLVRIFYGRPGRVGSIYEEARRANLARSPRHERRHFDLIAPHALAEEAA